MLGHQQISKLPRIRPTSRAAVLLYELPALQVTSLIAGEVSMTPEGWHKLFRWPSGANVFWKGNGFGVSAGHSRMRRARLAGMDGCFGVDPVAPCRVHARR
mgnify:CR=1 FL=1